MTDDTLLPFSFPAVRSKKITAAFDGGRITSDGGNGDMHSRDCAVRYQRDGRVLALATIFRDMESLEREAAMERAVASAAWANAAALPGAAAPMTG